MGRKGWWVGGMDGTLGMVGGWDSEWVGWQVGGGMGLMVGGWLDGIVCSVCGFDSF